MENTEALLELLHSVRSGNGDAFAALLEQFRPLLEAVSARFSSRFSPEEREDVMQEARWALYCAALHFDTAQDKVTFGLYAKICMCRALISRMRRESRCNLEMCSLEELDEGGTLELLLTSDTQSDVVKNLIDNEAAEGLYATVKSLLSDYEWRVFNRRMAGYSVAQIATDLHKPVKSVENAIRRGTVKLRSALR